MCSYINSNKIKYILCFMLIFIFLFHFSFKCYALGTLVFSLGIKVFIVILASMGILAWVQSGMGVEQFYEDFCNWCEQKKGEMEIRGILFNMVYQNLKTGAKMKVRKISGLIKEFLKTLTGSSRLDSTIKNPIIFENHTYKFEGYYDLPKVEDVYNTNIPQKEYYRIVDKYEIGNGYSLLFIIRVGTGFRIYPRICWEYNGELVENDYVGMMVLCEGYSSLSNLYIECLIESNGDILNVVTDIYSYVDNISYVKSKTVPFPELVGLREGLGEMDRPDTIPVPLDTPYELAFPIDGILDALDYVGKTYEELMEAIAAVSTTTYIDYLIDMPVSIVNTYEMPSICVDEGDVIVEVDIPDIPDYAPEIVEQTGILAKILAFLEGLFVIPDDLEFPDLKFDKFEGITLVDRFPFSIPWDLKNAFSAFAATAQEPVFNVDLDTKYFEVHHTIDYSFMNFCIGFFRYACLVAFTIFLITKTRDLIKW